jgi:hypothetical protein
MKRLALNLMMVSGCFLVLSSSAFAQRHGGGGGEGRMSVGGGGSAPAIHSEAPAVHNDAPAIQNGNSAIHNDANHSMVYGPNNHPFYGSDHGQGNDWRYRYDNGRWWYWGALGAWSYWNDGRWVDYGTPYTTAYRGPSAPSGWYWSNDAHRWFWFDGSTLSASQQ